MKRLLVLLIAAVTAMSLSGCQTTTPYAAIVNGTVISTSVMDGEIHAITSNPRYSAVLDQSLTSGGSPGLQPGGKNTMNATYLSQLVLNRVRVALIEQEAARLKVVPTDDMRKAARASLVGSTGDSTLLDSLPSNYRDYLINRQAYISAIVAKRNTPEAQLAYYNAHGSDYSQTCVRHILVPSKAAADSVRTRLLANGANGDWAGIAKAESIDNQGDGSSASKGGDLGCFSSSDLNSFIAPFRDAVKGLKTGDISQPVQTQFGFHVIEVTKRDQQPFSAAQPAIDQTLSDVSAFLSDALKKAKIKVNPKYGEFRPEDSTSGQPAAIVPHQPVVLNDGSPASSPDNNLLGGTSGTAPDTSTAPDGSDGSAVPPDSSAAPSSS